MTYAYAYRSGKIGFGTKIPKKALKIGEGDRKFTAQVRVRARLAYDNKTYLVPGIPESESEGEAVNALIKFREFVNQ